MTSIQNEETGRILWTDIETTELNPDTGHILELAFVVTDGNLCELGTFTHLVYPESRDWEESMDEYVTNMHTKNGLLKELADIKKTGYHEMYALTNVIGLARVWMMPFFSSGDYKPPLGGSSVHFDRAWLTNKCDILNMTSYRNIDVSVLFELAKRWDPGVIKTLPKRGVHRALSDVRKSIEFLIHYRDSGFIRFP